MKALLTTCRPPVPSSLPHYLNHGWLACLPGLSLSLSCLLAWGVEAEAPGGPTHGSRRQSLYDPFRGWE